jgi:DNA-binding MarR family transcriptional regulator
VILGTLLRKEKPANARSSKAGLSESGTSLSLIADVDYDLLPQNLGFWIRRAQLAIMKSFDEHLKGLKLRPVDAAALLLIGKNEDISQIDLTAALGTDQSTMVAICTRLEGRGFVERRRRAEDRRYQVLSLTAEGRKATAVVRKQLHAHNENVARNLSASQRKQLTSLLRNVVEDS